MTITCDLRVSHCIIPILQKTQAKQSHPCEKTLNNLDIKTCINSKMFFSSSTVIELGFFQKVIPSCFLLWLMPTSQPPFKKEEEGDYCQAGQLGTSEGSFGCYPKADGEEVLPPFVLPAYCRSGNLRIISPVMRRCMFSGCRYNSCLLPWVWYASFGFGCYTGNSETKTCSPLSPKHFSLLVEAIVAAQHRAFSFVGAGLTLLVC